MRDLSIPPWVERKRWLVDASWFTVWNVSSDLAQAPWEWPRFVSAASREEAQRAVDYLDSLA